MEIMTRKQELMIKRKREIRIASVVISVAAVVIACIVLYVNVISRAVMSPQINAAIGDCFYDSGDGTWRKAEVGTAVGKGFSFKTGQRSAMDILLQNDSAVRMTENAQMRLPSLDLADIRIELADGSAFCKIKKLYKGQGLSVKTPTAVAAVRGTEFSTEMVKRGDMSVTEGYCVGGVVDVSASDGKGAVVSLKKNSVCTSDAAGPGMRRNMTAQEIARVSSVIDSISLARVLVTTDKLLFETGSSSINKSMKPELERIFAVLKKTDARILIIGHTDAVGSPESNMTLSQARAESVKAYFISRGISAKSFDAQGMGGLKPLMSNATEEGRMKNRRVEFVVTK